MTHLQHLCHVGLSHIILADLQSIRQIVSVLLHRHLRENRLFPSWIPQLCRLSDPTVWIFITVFWFAILWLYPYLDLPWVKSQFQRKMLPINKHNRVAERILWQGASVVTKSRRAKSFQLSTRIHYTLLLEGMAVTDNGVISAKENKDLFSEGSWVHRHAFKQRGLTGKSVIYI